MSSSTRTGVQVAGFAVLYLAAAVAGRATTLTPGSLSLVWPAAGIAVVWFLTVEGGTARAVSALLAVLVTLFVHLVVWPAYGHVTVLAAGNLAQVAEVVILVRRWCPELAARSARPLDTQSGLVRFTCAAGIGCLAGVVSAVAVARLGGRPFALEEAVTWWGRNLCSAIGIGLTGLLTVDRLRHGMRRELQAPPGEQLLILGATSSMLALDYATGVPFAFLMPATTVWAGLRTTPLFVSLHGTLGGAAVIALALDDRLLAAGVASHRSGVLLAQLFVGMTLLIGLFLAAGREEARVLTEQLEDRTRELASFTRRAVHDLQNPLMVIEGWSDLLATQVRPGSTAAQMVDRIQGASAMMRNLVDDLLADATARDGRVQVRRVDLARLSADVVTAHGAEAVVRLSPMEPVVGDERLLRRLLDNLVGNALKYVEPGAVPDIQITSRLLPSGRLAVSVADRGIGIPEAEQDAVFDEFVRGHGDDYPGTGLGLSICRRIVDRHGGVITARSRTDGPGTDVTFDLPHWQGDPQRAGRDTTAPSLRGHLRWTPTRAS